MSYVSINIQNVVHVKQEFKDYPESDELFTTSKLRITDTSGEITTITLYGRSEKDLEIHQT